MVGRSRQRHLSWRQPRDGLAAGGFRRVVGRGTRDLIASLGPIGVGHLLAMAGILAPPLGELARGGDKRLGRFRKGSPFLLKPADNRCGPAKCAPSVVRDDKVEGSGVEARTRPTAE